MVKKKTMETMQAQMEKLLVTLQQWYGNRLKQSDLDFIKEIK
jgi:hypothetical protein